MSIDEMGQARWPAGRPRHHHVAYGAGPVAPTNRPASPPLWTLAYWPAPGVIVAAGLASAHVIGPWTFAVFATALLVAAPGFLTRPLATRAAWFGVCGLAATPFALAWMNRGGCVALPGGRSCTEAWYPGALAVTGGVLVVTGVAGYVWQGRRERARARRLPVIDGR